MVFLEVFRAATVSERYIYSKNWCGIKGLIYKDLDEKIKGLRLELSKERANINIGANVSSPGKVREIRRTIAKILTVKGEKYLLPNVRLQELQHLLLLRFRQRS